MLAIFRGVFAAGCWKLNKKSGSLVRLPLKSLGAEIQHC